jgi:hypothetical protein
MSDEKKSWRDRDRRNDGSRHIHSERQDAADIRASKAHKKLVGALFDGKGERPSRLQDMFDELREEEAPEDMEWKRDIKLLSATENFREFVELATVFQKTGRPWPDNEDLLLRLLEHPRERVIFSALSHYLQLASRKGIERKEGLKSRLATLSAMAEDSRILRSIDNLSDFL